MFLYHGTMDRYAENIKNKGILLYKSKEFLDFSKGFYTSNDKRLAIKTAYTVSGKNNAFGNPFAYPAIIQFQIDDNAFSTQNVKEFIGQSDEWKRFIINNRLGKDYIDFFKRTEHNIDSKYDIVIGETADGTIDSFIDSIKIGERELDARIYQFADFRKSLGKQISFHTLSSVSCLSYVCCSIMSLREE